MNKIAITGSKGTIGTVLYKQLASSRQVLGLDLPDVDITNYQKLMASIKGVDTIIHLAFSPGLHANHLNPINVQLELSVLNAAVDAGIRRVIIASSVHADNFLNHANQSLLSTPGSYQPTGAYGAHKLLAEEVTKFYANRYGIEGIAIRFGGVTTNNSVKTNHREPEVWLSHHDLTQAIEACIEAPSVPDNFNVFYAVSNNKNRIHDTKNPFGWVPTDNSADYL